MLSGSRTRTNSSQFCEILLMTPNGKSCYKAASLKPGFRSRAAAELRRQAAETFENGMSIFNP
jgi:hypothetical protein